MMTKDLPSTNPIRPMHFIIASIKKFGSEDDLRILDRLYKIRGKEISKDEFCARARALEKRMRERNKPA